MTRHFLALHDFSKQELDAMLALAEQGIARLQQLQQQALATT